MSNNVRNGINVADLMSAIEAVKMDGRLQGRSHHLGLCRRKGTRKTLQKPYDFDGRTR